MKKKALALLLSLLLILSIAACGASSSSKDSGTTGGATAPELAEGGAAADGDSGGIAQNKQEPPTAADENGVPEGDKIIYSAYAEIETRDFEASVDGVYALIDRFGGFLETSSITGNDYYGTNSSRSARFVIRIPAQHFDALMTSLSELGNVPYSSTNAQNITAQYNDTQSRLDAYQIEYDRLLSMLSKAANVEEMLAIEQRLSDVRYNIQSLSDTISGWDSLISYSTVEIQLEEVVDYTDQPVNAQNYWQEVAAAFFSSLRAIGNFFKGFLKVIVAITPVLVIIVPVAALCVFAVRKLKLRRKAKDAPEKKGDGGKKE